MLSKITDLGRIAGATAIFYYHIGLVTNYRFSEWGEYAVATFIFISGIAYACFSSVQPHDLPSYGRFIVGRLKAIYPMFIVINLLIFLASFLYPSALGRPFSILELVLSSTGLSQYFDFRYLSKVMWFIPFILQAYLVFPAVTALLKRISAVWIILFAFAVSLSAIALAFIYLPTSASDICRNWSVIFRLPEACMGIVIGKTVLRRSDFKNGLIATAVFVVGSFVLATWVASHFDQASYILSLPWHGAVVSLGIAVLATAAAPAITQARVLALVRLMGTASFPFFLLHGIAILFVYRHCGASVTPWLAYFAFCWCEAIVFTLAFRYIGQAIQRSRRSTL